MKHLMNAIIDNNLDKVMEELESTRNINELDNSLFLGRDGETCVRRVHWSPVDLAFHLGRVEITRFLLGKGAITGTSIDKAFPDRFKVN
jgi:hypothetical protein